MRRGWKNLSKGFTLMEVIVVIAILAILAAVAVPTISGYIEKSKETADLQSARSILTALTTVYALNTGIVPEGGRIVVRWDTSVGGGSPAGKGDVVIEHRTFGNFHTAADGTWIAAFRTKFDEYMEKNALGDATSKKSQNSDLLIWYDTATGDMYTHTAYMADWGEDGIGLDLEPDVF